MTRTTIEKRNEFASQVVGFVQEKFGVDEIDAVVIMGKGAAKMLVEQSHSPEGLEEGMVKYLKAFGSEITELAEKKFPGISEEEQQSADHVSEG